MTERDPVLEWSLAAMRLAGGAFLLVWASERVLAPGVARQVYETFYFSSPSDAVLLASGLVQGVIVLAFMAGLWRTLTYGLVLAMNLVGVGSTVARLADPYTVPNHLFWAGVPVVVMFAVLLALRSRDRRLTLAR